MSKKYEHGDIATFYFVVISDKEKRIQGWTDDKDLAKYYMDFHKCKRFILKEITRPIDEINKILEENLHDEIVICNIVVKSKEKKKGFDVIPIPATNTEILFINEEVNGFMTSYIDYGYLNQVIPYLDKEYQRALRDIFLSDIIKQVIHSKKSNIAMNIQYDQLSILFRSFPEYFGK